MLEHYKPFEKLGLPAGCTIQRLLYNAPSDTIVVHVNVQNFRKMQITKLLYFRKSKDEGYTLIADPELGSTFDSPVVCSRYPYLYFTKSKIDLTGAARPLGVFCANLESQETHPVMSYDGGVLNSWVPHLVGVALDGEHLYCTVGITQENTRQYFLSRLDLQTKEIHRISQLPSVFA